MSSISDHHLENANESRPFSAMAVPAQARDGSRLAPAEATAHPDHRAVDAATDPPPAVSPPPPGAPSRHRRRGLLWAGAVAGLALGGYFLVPIVRTMLETVSTDDAYVNGHVTFVAPRVPGQVARVLVNDNNRVKKGALLVQLDKEPYQVQVDIKKAAVVSAEADFKAAEAQVRAILGQARSLRWKLQTAIEQVDNQVALLAHTSPP